MRADVTYVESTEYATEQVPSSTAMGVDGPAVGAPGDIAELATKTEMLHLFDGRGVLVDPRPNFPNSVSSTVMRLVLDGQRAVAVGSDAAAHDQVCALLDLLALHAVGASVPGGPPTVVDEVTVLVGRDPGKPGRADEALGGLRTLRAQLVGSPRVRILVWNGADAEFIRDEGNPPDYAGSVKAGKYRAMLDALADGPPDVLRRTVAGLNLDGLRAYPMLTRNPWWSLRLEGLEVGQFRGDRPDSWLEVGSPGKTGDSSARRAWLAAVQALSTEDISGRVLVSAIGPDCAGQLLKAFAEKLHAATTASGKQNEHALESRILRGDCPVTLGDGVQLELLRGAAPYGDAVNWGSQFPTLWGDTSGSARYLDALMHIGPVPYAVEMKVESQGVGKYYRHAIAQAVLYRHFILSATPVHPWFAARGLDPAQCRAVVVVPQARDSTTREWITRHRALAAHFDVEFLEVDAAKAYAHAVSSTAAN